jgi:hypothetical protein
MRKVELRGLKHFLRTTKNQTPATYVVGPIRHAARYNRAFREVHPNDREEIRALKAGIDVTGYMLIIDDQHLVHCKRQHGNRASEAKRGQLPISDDDICKLPQILGDPDAVEGGTSRRRGPPSALVTKALGNISYTVIVEARTQKRDLSFVTIFKSRLE